MKLEAKNLCMKYKNNERKILKQINLKMNSGEFVALMGESGSGKSTLLACLTGILKPLSGTVMWQDTDIYELGDFDLSKIHRNVIGYVPQSNVFLKEYTVLENIILPYLTGGDRKVQWVERARELLESLGIAEKEKHYPHELSGGELKRVSIARAILMNPDVIVADEPTTGLDQNTGNLILQYLSDYAKTGKLVIVASHDQQVNEYCSVVYKLVEGEILLNEK